MEGNRCQRIFFLQPVHVNDDSEYGVFMRHNFVRNSHCTHAVMFTEKCPVLRRPRRSKHEYRKIQGETHKIVFKQMLHLLLLL